MQSRTFDGWIGEEMEENRNLRKVQLEALEVLCELDRVCSILNVSYYITAGTLLGAVRNGGFIPWDDDIDVVMKRSDYDRFARESSAILGTGYFYQDHHTHCDYPFGFAKIRKRGSTAKEKIVSGASFEMGAFVDIFPLDVCPNAEKKARLFFKATTLLNYTLINRCNGISDIETKRFAVRPFWRIASWLPTPWLFAVRNVVRDISSSYGDGRILCTVSGRHGYPKESYAKEWFDKTVELEFEGKMFKAPAQWDAILKNMYGDYLTPIKEDSGHICL